jgi:glyoxylase-like metal-dependent hydrolase (beta-lactamase superfamily II)
MPVQDPAPDIAPGVHRLGSHLVNWYLIEDQGRLTAVDAGLPGFRKRLEPDLAALNHLPADVAAVVLTHSDSDHTGLAVALRDAGARVLIHSADEPALRRPGPKSGEASPAKAVREMWRPAFWRFIGGMARAGGARPPKIEGAETFADGDVLDVPGRPRVVHTPGHTAGHCVLLFESHRALFTGDELCMRNPITGVVGPQLMPRFTNVSNDQCVESLVVIEPLEADLLLPGHGEPWLGAPATAVDLARRARSGS